MAENQSQPVEGPYSERLRAGIDGVDPLLSPRLEEAVATTTIPHEGYAMGVAWYGIPWVSPTYERTEVF